MYNVSDDFRSVMKMPAQTRRLYGTIGTFEFKQKNVLQGTFSITNQCSDNSNIQIGQVYIGELKATFRGLNIPRNSWKGKEIIAYQGLKVNDTFEDVLIGHYFIDDANWSKAGVDVTAYDAMSKFDKNLSLTTSSGTVFDFISYACDVCKVELGMTKEEISNFPNGKELLGIYDENDMEHVGWYYIPVRAGKPVWTEPYDNANINEKMVSYVIPVYDNNVLVGVIGMDIDFTIFQNIICVDCVY